MQREFENHQLYFNNRIMATKATPNQRVFKIRRQTFQRKITRDCQWIVYIEAHDHYGEEIHPWTMKISYNSYNWNLGFSGSVMDKNLRFERCAVEIFIKSIHGLKTRKQYTIGPMFGYFNDPSTYSVIYDPRIYQLTEDQMDILINIASCEENFFEKLKISMDQGLLTDTVIKTKDRPFPCHKFVLASHSEYFKKMFQTDMKESQTNCVEWTEVFDASVVKDLLHFFYTGQKPPNIGDNHFGLLQAAHLCLLPDLKSMCVESIVPIITVENAALVLQSAVIYESYHLQKAALKFVAEHWDEIVAKDFFQKLDPEIYSTLFKIIFEMFRKNILDEGKTSLMKEN